MKIYQLTLREINELIKDVEERKRWMQRKTDELAKRLAEIGAEQAQIGFDSDTFMLVQKASTVTVVPGGEGRYIVRADGENVLFIEFGAGNIGAGHPEAEVNGMGPGTYPGQSHVPTPGWWYLPKEVQEATGRHKSFGNPPEMPMYNAVKYLEQELDRIVQEVFERD